MLGRTLTRCAYLATIVAAQYHSVVPNVGDMDGGALHSSLPPPLLNSTSEVLSSTQTTLSTSTTSAPYFLRAANLYTTATLNRTSATSLSTTTIIVSLPNPTPTPNTDPSRSETGDLSDDQLDDASTSLETGGPSPLSRWPQWITAATFTLLFYDILTVAIFVWLWVFGYLWWFRRGGRPGNGWGRGILAPGPVELARMAELDFAREEARRYEMTGQWVRSGGRMRSARELELEREMIALGMI